MKINNAEVLKNTGNVERVDLQQVLLDAKGNVAEIELEAQEAEEEARSLELELLEVQAAQERKEEAERKGKETGEKIAGIESA